MAKLTKKISYVLLSLVATLCFVLAIIPAIKRPTSVQAAEATSTTIEIQDSASVRLDEYSGIRFTANVGKTFYGEQGEDATWGFLVALGVDGLTTENFVVTNESVNQVKISSWISDSWSTAVKAKKAGLKEYTLVLNNIPVNAYQMAISARAYVEVNGEYTYSPTFTTRNIHEVANAALLDNTLTFTDSEKDNLLAFVSSCSEDENGVILHTWADRGYIASQGGYVKKCSVCGVEYISDPVYAFKDGEGVVLDRGGLEIRQLNANTDIIKTFEATVKTPYKLGKTAVIFSNLPDYDKRATLEDGLEIGINSDGFFSVTIGKGNSYTFSTAAIDNGSNWYHMAMTFDTDTNEIKLYVNGTLAETKTSDLALSSVKLSDRPFYFGRNYHSGNPNAFEGNGFIKNAAIWSSVRSEADIKGDMSYIYNFHGNLMGLYDFNEEVIDNVLADHSLKNNALQVHETWFAMDDEQKALLGDYAYSLAVVGDMQSLVNYYPDKVDDLYQWVLDKQEEYKIEYLIGLGDLTENKYSYHGSVAGDWYPQIEGFNMLNGKVTHQQVRGNHDQTDYYNNVLETDEYMVNLNGYYGYGVENSYSIVYMGGYKYCFINMNNPTSTVYSQEELDWACSVIEKYSDARVIISTHSVLAWTGDFQDTGDAAGTVYWENVIKKYSNVMMVYCGHIAWDPILLVRSTGDNGNTVNQMLIDAQYMDQNYGPKGMVAMFYFTEDGKSVKVRYFSSIEDKMFSLDNCFTIDTTEYADLGKNAADTDAPVVTANNQEEGLVGVRYFIKDVLVRDDKDASVTPTYTLYKKSDATKTPITLDANRSFVPAEAGTYVLKIDVKDAAGNSATYEFDIFVRGAELGAGVIEDFGTEDTLITYKGHATTEWLSSYEGKDGVIHFAAGTGKNSIGYKNYNFRIINTYEDLDLAGKYIKLRVYASADATLYSGYADYDGYGQSQSLVGGAWSVITVKYPSDMEFFMDRASSTSGVRLFTIKEDVDIYVDEIWVGEETAFGAVNFDEASEISAIVEKTNATLNTNRQWLPEYDGAEGVFKATFVSDIWYGIHFALPYTAEEILASDWSILEFRIQMTWGGGMASAPTGVSVVKEGNWRTYSMTRESLVEKWGSEASMADRLTSSSRDAYSPTFVFWDNANKDFYFDYIKLVTVDPANTEFDSSASTDYVLVQSDVSWLSEYEGAKGVVKGKIQDSWHGIQLKLPYTVAELQALTWHKVEIRITFDFTGTYTTWDNFLSNAAGFTYVDDGAWRIYSTTKAGIISKFGTVDQFYTVLTDGVDGWGEHNLFAINNSKNMGYLYIDYFRFVGDTTSSEEDATAATTYVEDFNTATAVNSVAGVGTATYLDNFMGAQGVVKGTVNTTDSWQSWFKFNLGVNQTSIEALDWDLFKFRVMFDLSGSRNAWDGYYENPANFTFVTEGPWRVYTATRENIIAGYGSIDAFFTKINSGEKLFDIWSPGAHGNIYYDWVKFTSVANETRLVVENDFTTDSSWLKGANNVTLLDSYDGCTGVVKATPVTDNGFQFKFPYTKAQLEAMDWDRLEFKVRFGSGHYQSVNGSTENGINYNLGGWVFRTEGNWRVYSAKKANLVKMYGSLDAMYNVLLNANGSAAYRLFNVWNMWTLGDMYIDYVKLV